MQNTEVHSIIVENPTPRPGVVGIGYIRNKNNDNNESQKQTGTQWSKAGGHIVNERGVHRLTS